MGVMGAVGFVTTAVSIGLSLFPSENEANKPLAALKVVGLTAVMLAAGVAVYWRGRRRAEAPQGL